MFAVNLHPVSDRASGLLRPPFSIAVLNFLCAFFFFLPSFHLAIFTREHYLAHAFGGAVCSEF